MPTIEKPFDLMDDDIVELYTQDKSLKNKTGLYDDKWWEKSKSKP